MGDLEPVYDLFTITTEFTLPHADTVGWSFPHKPCHFSYGELSYRGPTPLEEIQSLGEVRGREESVGEYYDYG